MNVYCMEDFKKEVEKLKNKDSYADIEKEIIEYFFGQTKTIADIKSGDLLNNSDDRPYIKKRLRGRGGFRVYFLLIIIEKCVYLMYVHPKSGTFGSDNITTEAKSNFLDKMNKAIGSNALYVVKPDSKNTKLVFTNKKENIPQ